MGNKLHARWIDREYVVLVQEDCPGCEGEPTLFVLKRKCHDSWELKTKIFGADKLGKIADVLSEVLNNYNDSRRRESQ